MEMEIEIEIEIDRCPANVALSKQHTPPQEVLLSVQRLLAMGEHAKMRAMEVPAISVSTGAPDQIVGILKAKKNDMEAELKEAIADEEKAIAGYLDLKASKEAQ